jgi:polar amino acid transport system substrate-binding protein
VKRSDGRVVAFALAIALVLTVGACAAAKRTAAGDFAPASPGHLKVATDLPAPAFWSGDDPKWVDGGFEWGIAHDLADAFDLDLTVVDVPFGDIIGGKLRGADLALAQVSITKEREKAVDFSTPYFTSQPTVVARKGRDLTDLATAREWTWSARESTTEADFIDDVIRPDDDAQLTRTEQEALDAVRAGRVDAALLDLPTALILTKDSNELEAISCFDRTEDYGIVLPNESGNVEVVNKQLASMRSDGTIQDLDDTWLEPAFAKSPGDLPVIRTP